MNVLSLFDGMSCGQIALNKAGFKIENYFACEIDKYAIQVTQANYPNTQQLGDVTKVSALDLPTLDVVIGGSPCQGFSFAGKQLNFEDSRSKLFFEFVRLLKEARVKNPNVKFLLENVKMKKEYQDVISNYLGVEPIEINSALVSAQNRKRLYWTNLGGVIQPKDKDIILKDILEETQEGKLSEAKIARVLYSQRGKGFFYSAESHLKIGTLIAGYAKEPTDGSYIFQKNNSLFVPEATKKGFVEINDGEGVDLTFITSKTRRGRRMEDKSNCLTAAAFDYNYFKDGVIRKITTVECERLQTVPDNYTAHVSNSQRYKMLGNGWTVDVIAHILQSDISL